MLTVPSFVGNTDVKTAMADSSNPSRQLVFPVVGDANLEDINKPVLRVGLLKPGPPESTRKSGAKPGMPVYWHVYAARDHHVVHGPGMVAAAKTSDVVRLHLCAISRSRLLWLFVVDEIGGDDDEWTSVASYFGGRAKKTEHVFGSEDATLAAIRQAKLGVALSESFEMAVQDSAGVRLSSNGENSALHVDTGKYGLMTSTPHYCISNPEHLLM